MTKTFALGVERVVLHAQSIVLPLKKTYLAISTQLLTKMTASIVAAANQFIKSEAGIQKLMLQKKMIGFPRYIINVGERFILQVLMPNKMRGWIFQKLARN